MAIIVKTQTLVLIIYLNKMAQKTYRQQTSGTLGTLTNCPGCGPGPTSTYATATCANNYLHYVDEISGFDGQQAVLLQPYSVGDVVWIKTGASATIECATITSVNNSDPATHYIDEAQGPWSQCSQCYTP
jgi:hypothetical protein